MREPGLITLDRETHRYSNGLPSVTQILQGANIINPEIYTQESKDRGTAVHAACEYWDKGDLDESELDSRIVPYLDAYKLFRMETRISYEWIEAPMDDAAHLYAGMPDRVIISRPAMLIDIKSGAPERWHHLQTAAYVNMFADPFSFQRFSLYLNAGGKYRLVEHPKTEYIADLGIFINALNIHYWKGNK
jgi:hypothetical protein